MKIIREYIKDFNSKPKERKHIILLDGTWNDETGLNADGLVTNIVNMHRVFNNDEDNQIVRYHRGVGNDNDNDWIGAAWKGATGKAVGKIVEQAYARFVQDWQKGDKIYIFGFSRGAAGARMLASKINERGVPCSIKIWWKPKENNETKVIEQVICKTKVDNSNFEKVNIEFLGVWDTVSAFGLGNNALRLVKLRKNDLFTDENIASNIKKAVHLVSIDETRNPFVPSLMNHKEGVTHEVWFPGVHSDVGGSYKEDSIAKVSLHYMISQMKQWNSERGLKDFIINHENYMKCASNSIEEAYFHFHGNAFGENLRSIHVQEDGKKSQSKKPLIHDLYREITSKKNSYSVVDINTADKLIETKYINFQYMPFNVKMLDNNFEVVK